jgi:hypothetical protein
MLLNRVTSLNCCKHYSYEQTLTLRRDMMAISKSLKAARWRREADQTTSWHGQEDVEMQGGLRYHRSGGNLTCRLKVVAAPKRAARLGAGLSDALNTNSQCQDLGKLTKTSEKAQQTGWVLRRGTSSIFVQALAIRSPSRDSPLNLLPHYTHRHHSTI